MFKYLLILFVLIGPKLFAQNSQKLSYTQAVEQTLQNNFDIRLAKNLADQSSIENNYGAAGFLPSLDIIAGASNSSNNTRQEFSSGLVVDKNAVASSSINAGAYLSWTIFDGMKMFATKERLSLLSQQGELSFKIEIENTLENLTLMYYRVVMQEQLISGLRKAMELSELRITIAQRKSQLGSGSDVEMLQAKMDRNAQKSNLIAQQSNLKEYKNNLLMVMKAEQTLDFAVDTNFVFEEMESIESLKQKIEKSNATLNYLQKNSLIVDQLKREIQAQNLPRIGLSSSYVFGKNQNAAGFALLNQNLGYNFGVNLNWNIFNGFTEKNKLKVVSLQKQSASLQIEQTKNSLFTASTSAYLQWLGNKEIMELEEENGKLAAQSLRINAERLKLGLGNYLEIKESESSYEAALTRLVNARYNLKAAETTLKKLSGGLVK